MEDLWGLVGTGVFFGVVAAYFHRRWSNRRFYELANKIPGPPGLPVLGHALTFLGNPNSVMMKVLDLSEKYPTDVIKLWIGNRLMVYLTHPADIELLLSSNVHLEKAIEYEMFAPWFGNGLLISQGRTWRAHRKMIAPTFHLNVLRTFMDRFNRNARDVVSRMATENGKTFDAHDYMSECTVETLIETVMGVQKDSIMPGKVRSCLDYALDVMKLCDVVFRRQTQIWLKYNVLFSLSGMENKHNTLLSAIHSLTSKVMNRKLEDMKSKPKTVVEEKIEKLEKVDANEGFSFGQSSGLKDDLDVDDIGTKKRLPFLEQLIESAQNNEVISEKEVKHQLDTIMFEGHDTTAAGSSFFLCLMGAHPDIQEKILAEVDSIFGDSDRDVTFQDTLELKYMERCIMETLRLYPPVPAISRELRQEMTLSKETGSIVLPPNCTVNVATFKLHRREDIYPEALKFNPDNFLPEKSASRHFYSFVPFSAGPRSCVGRKYAMLKLKIILATIMRNFKVKPGIPEKDWKLQADIILKRTDGFNVQLEPRKKIAAA